MNGDRRIRIGTRGSALARTQSQWVVDQLRGAGAVADLEMISTQGDARNDVPISRIGGDGVFVRELERALLECRIDAAVHSLKDMPTAETPGLLVACVPIRETPFDVFVGRRHATLESLPTGAVVGTSSIRRVVQVRALRDDLVVRGIRGNVDTRLRRLDDGDYDGLILAGAGLRRLGLGHRITQVLRPDAFWPAVAQGALAVQIRADDAAMRDILRPLDDPATHQAVRAERSCLAELAGGCLAPIGAWARHDAGGRLELGACVLEDRGGRILKVFASQESAPDEGGRAPELLGQAVAGALLSQGAEEMLRRMRQSPT
jgi:hydroxymethylbilane synthase